MEKIHVATLILTTLVIVNADHQVFQYIRGKRKLLQSSFVIWTHRLVWAGLIGMIATGILLTIPMWKFLISEFSFYVKIGFVLTLCVNAFFIEKLSRVATERSWDELVQDERTLFYISGALSVVGWISAAMIGIFFL